MKKVRAKKVIQAFLLANELKKVYRKIDNLSDYKKIYSKIKKKIGKYSEEDLWKRLEDDGRVKRYKSCDWYFGKIKIESTGLWPRMGHIADNLLVKDAKWSAKQIFVNSDKLLKREVNHLFRILPFAHYLNKHIPTIVIKDSSIRKKKGYLKEKYDIDDGCHRTVCLVLQGETSMNAYVGIKKE